MITHGLVTVRRISSRIFFATLSSRYSSRYFIAILAELPELFQDAVCPGRLFLVHAADGKADMDHYVIADHGFRNIFEARFTGDAAEIHLRHADAVTIVKLYDLSWNRE